MILFTGICRGQVRLVHPLLVLVDGDLFRILQSWKAKMQKPSGRTSVNNGTVKTMLNTTRGESCCDIISSCCKQTCCRIWAFPQHVSDSSTLMIAFPTKMPFKKLTLARTTLVVSKHHEDQTKMSSSKLCRKRCTLRAGICRDNKPRVDL